MLRKEDHVALMSPKTADITLQQAQKAIDTVRQQFPHLSMLVLMGCETNAKVDAQDPTAHYRVRSGAFGALDEIAVMLRDGIPRLLDQLREETETRNNARAGSPHLKGD